MKEEFVDVKKGSGSLSYQDKKERATGVERFSPLPETPGYLEFEEFERIGEPSTEDIPRHKGPHHETGSHNEGSRQ